MLAFTALIDSMLLFFVLEAVTVFIVLAAATSSGQHKGFWIAGLALLGASAFVAFFQGDRIENGAVMIGSIVMLVVYSAEAHVPGLHSTAVLVPILVISVITTLLAYFARGEDTELDRVGTTVYVTAIAAVIPTAFYHTDWAFALFGLLAVGLWAWWMVLRGFYGNPDRLEAPASQPST